MKWYSKGGWSVGFPCKRFETYKACGTVPVSNIGHRCHGERKRAGRAHHIFLYLQKKVEKKMLLKEHKRNRDNRHEQE